MGRKRIYPLCPNCGKAVVPDRDNGKGAHTVCPKVRGPHKPKANKPTPVVTPEEKQEMAKTAHEAIVQAHYVPSTSKLNALEKIDMAAEGEEFPAPGVFVVKPNLSPDVADRVGQEMSEIRSGNKYNELSQRDVEQVISNTVGSRRYLVKHEGKWYLTDDRKRAEDIGVEGKGYARPKDLLREWVKAIGFLRDEEGNLALVSV